MKETFLPFILIFSGLIELALAQIRIVVPIVGAVGMIFYNSAVLSANFAFCDAVYACAPYM